MTGARLLGGGDPPEPPAELAVVVALECVLAVEVLSVFLVVPLAADVDEEVGLGGAFAGGEEPVLVGATFEGVPEPTPGVGEVVTETDVGGNGEPVDTVAPAGVVEASALTGPTLASTDTVGTAGVGGTATVTVGTGAADACAMAVSDTMPDAHSGRRTDRERTRIARFKASISTSLAETPVSTSLTEGFIPTKRLLMHTVAASSHAATACRLATCPGRRLSTAESRLMGGVCNERSPRGDPLYQS